MITAMNKTNNEPCDLRIGDVYGIIDGRLEKLRVELSIAKLCGDLVKVEVVTAQIETLDWVRYDVSRAEV